jgi:serpin B
MRMLRVALSSLTTMIAAMPLRAQSDGADDGAELAEAFGRFGARTMASLPAGNLCYSPASTALALMMSLAGAHGETAKEMAAVLAPEGWDEARLHAAAAVLLERLQRSDEGFQLACAQDAWPQTGHALLPAYVGLLRDRYGAEPRAVDYAGDLEKARATINARIAEVTAGRIPELLASDDLQADTRFVLTNALWLKAAWAKPFPPEDTRDRPFHLDQDHDVVVPTMHLNGKLPVAETDAMVAVRLLYAGGDFALDLALPRGDATLDSAMTALVADRRVFGPKLEASQASLSLPRFRLENRMILNDPLQAAGIRRAFTADADFRRIDGDPKYFSIALVLQKTWFDVAEKGTEAAAATAIVKRAGAARPQTRVVRFDRPFAFVLRDLKTGLALFAGRCVDPSGNAAAR